MLALPFKTPKKTRQVSMLQAIRDKITGWLAYLIIFLIAIPFALWGLHNYAGGGRDSVVATVNGQDITQQQLDRVLAQERQRLAQMFGGTLPPGFLEQMNLTSQVEKRLIDDMLLRQFAQKQALTTSIADFQQAVLAMPVFHDESGNFSRERYAQQLQANGLTIPEFEQQLRQQLALQKFYQGLAGSEPFLPEFLLATQAAFQEQSRDLAYVLWPLAKALPSEISLEEKEAYFAEHSADFQTELQVKISYLRISPEDLAKTLPQSDDSILQSLYQEQKARFTREETRLARHILLIFPPNASAETKAARRAEIESLRARIQAGEDFATLAKTSSEDPGSASAGGDLGEVSRGMMVEPFEEALFALTLESPLSLPVETQFGWHLILLEAITPEKTQSFAEVKAILAEEDRLQRAQSAFYGEIDRLSTLVFENPENLQAIAELLGQPLQQSDWFTANPTDLYFDIAKEAVVRQAAFRSEVLAGKVSSLIELADGSVVVLQIAEKKPPEAKAFAEVEAEIEDLLKKQKASEKIMAEAERWQQTLTGLSLTAVQAVLAQENLTLQQVSGLKRTDSLPELPADLIVQAFLLPAATWQVVTVNGNDVALLYVDNVHDGVWADLAEDRQQRLRTSLGDTWQQMEEALFFKTLYDKAKIARPKAVQSGRLN
jgi:peptidyl-prolyl cis-trans isomerase D